MRHANQRADQPQPSSRPSVAEIDKIRSRLFDLRHKIHPDSCCNCEACREYARLTDTLRAKTPTPQAPWKNT